MTSLLIRSVGSANRSYAAIISCRSKSHLSSVSYCNRTCTNLVQKCTTEIDHEFLASSIMMAKSEDLTIKPFGKIDDKNLMFKNAPDCNKASQEQLDDVANTMKAHLPKFLTTPHPFILYSKDVVLINNIRSLRVQGIGPYAFQVSLFKLYHIVKYSHSKLELLNLVKYPEESCVKIRWRIVSKPGILRFMLFFLKFHSTEIWKDGISSLYVNKEGLIYCHVCDNIDIEEDKASMKKTIKSSLVDRGIHV